MGSEDSPSTGYAWFDSEFTSLELGHAHLLQVALVLTDRYLKPVGVPLNLVLKLDTKAVISEWTQENLKDLMARCSSAEAVGVDEADRLMSSCMDDAFGPPAKSIKERPVLAGNSVHSDWVMAERLLPAFSKRLHYRHLDVSTLKIQWQDYFQGLEFDKTQAGLVAAELGMTQGELAGKEHDALYDVYASIAELAYYRRQLQKT